MWVWIVVAVVVVGLGAFGFWPRGGGVSHRNVRASKQLTQGRTENYNNPSGPNFGGRGF